MLKLIGLGPYQYVLDGYNRFDGVIVIFSIVELALSPPQFLAPGNTGTAGGISALQLAHSDSNGPRSGGGLL